MAKDQGVTGLKNGFELSRYRHVNISTDYLTSGEAGGDSPFDVSDTYNGESQKVSEPN